MGAVAAIWRYPVKSAHGERARGVTVEAGGLRGDRRWACLDDADGTVGSAKDPRRWGPLLQVRATMQPATQEHATLEQPRVPERDDERDDERDGVQVHVAGRAWPAGSWQADRALTTLLGRPVRMTRTVPADARLHRLLPEQAGLVPEWMTATPGQEVVTSIDGARPGGRFVDFGAVHLVTTGALVRLGRHLGRPGVEAVRFRPNLVIDADVDPAPGSELSLGTVVLRVLFPTPRCVVPGLRHGALPDDRELLTTLARHHRRSVPGLGRAAFFGTYAEVVRPGRVQLGDPVRAAAAG